MYLSMISGFLFANMVFATVLRRLNLGYKINYGGEVMKQDVSLDYGDNLIKIEAPAIEGKTPASLIHQTEGMTQYRQAGYCFMLSNGFDMFSSDMDEWYEDVEEVVMQSRDPVFYNYTISPFDINRENIPPVMQDECDEIYSAVLHNTIQGNAARRQLTEGDTPFMAVIFGPERQVKNENSRRNRRFTDTLRVSPGIFGMNRPPCSPLDRLTFTCGIIGPCPCQAGQFDLF